MGGRLDIIDRHILEELSINSRMLATKLAKKNRLSKQALQYRMQRMESEGVVNAYITYVDWAKLGFIRCQMIIKHSPISDESYAKIMEKCRAEGAVHITRCDGEWNMLVGYLARTHREIYEKSNRIRQAFGAHMLHWRTATIVDVSVKSMPSYFNEKDSGMLIGTLGKEGALYNADEKDILILKALATDARAPYAKLAAATRLPPETVRFRMKRLEKEKAIMSYGVSINPELEGFNHFMVLVRFSNPDNKKIDELIKFLLSIPKTRRVARLVSTVDLMYEVRAKDEKEIRAIKDSVDAKFEDIIQAQNVLRMYGENLFAFFPPLAKAKRKK
ncbi:MAG TPA: AsnC family transcriptional regulator [Candidatus Micrarchaeota archaeon]|nr:AsnC family transcriptional regulator [Candidatus Micrarchaeota archaeon]